MAPHGDSLCDDVLLCLIAQPGRQAGQPNHRQRVRSPLTGSAVKESFWLRKQSPRTCRVNCGCIIVLKCTRPAHTWGEAGAIQSLRKAFFCSVQPSCVHDRERPQDSSMSIPTHFASILAHYSRVDTGCPRAVYRHIAFHSRGCVEPQRSGGEERAARVLVWRHVI